MRIAYFTAGTIGAGHHVRGTAIGRALARARFGGEYRTFGPALPFPRPELATHRAVALDPTELRDPRRAPESALGRALGDFDPDLVLVDMFWAPIHHVLGALRGAAWLLARKCPAVWFVGPTPEIRFDRSRFARVLGIEPHLDPPPQLGVEPLDPIVIANPSECRPPEALKLRLGVPVGATLDVVVHAGRAGERAALQASAPNGARVLDLFDGDALFPAAEWLNGADRIACGAGYNSFWEAHWLGYADRTTFTPFERPIDDQAWRVRACLGHVMQENGADALAREAIARGGSSSRAP